MIKASELRIGNWLMACNDYYFRVDTNSLLNIEQKERSISDSECPKGVPITPEILEKCGFYDYKEQCRLSLKPLQQGYALLRRESIRDEGVDSYIEIIHIKYLHELQNIFFALTGEELEIKEL